MKTPFNYILPLLVALAFLSVPLVAPLVSPQANAQDNINELRINELIVQGNKQHLSVAPDLLTRFSRNDGSGENRGSRTVENTGSGKPSPYNDDIELWLTSHYIEGETDDEHIVGESYFIQFGADHSLSKDFIIGVMGEYDNKNFKQSTSPTEVLELDIEGWTATSFLLGNIKKYNLNVETTASYGEGETKGEENLETERLGFSTAISSDFQRKARTGTDIIYTPKLKYSYLKTERKDNNKELELNQLSAGITASTDIKSGKTVFSPTIGFNGIYDSEETENKVTGRLNGKLYFYGKNGINWHIGGHIDIINDNKDLKTKKITSGLNVRF